MQAYGEDIEAAGFRSRRQRVKLQSSYLNNEGLLADLDDIGQTVLYGNYSKTYDSNTHVKVRVLYSDEFAVDLDSGLKRKESFQKDEYDTEIN